MKILVVNVKYFGDLVVSTPGLKALRKAKPDAEIIVLVRKGFEEILSTNPYINGIMIFDSKLKGNNSFGSFIEGIRFIKKIRKEKFDIVITLHPGDRTAFWAWFSKAKLRIAPRKQSFGFLFNRRINVSEDSISYLDYYNHIFSELTGKIDSLKTEIIIPENEERFANDFLDINNYNRQKYLIGIHPSASEPSKIWPVSNFIDLIKLLNVKDNVEILLIEGPQDKAICNEIKKQFRPDELKFYSSASILKTGALIKNCNLFITHDTGTRHLAVALETPVLALLPDDNLKYWNFYDKIPFHHSIIGKRSIPGKEPNEKTFLNGITVDSVYKEIAEILNL